MMCIWIKGSMNSSPRSDASSDSFTSLERKLQGALCEDAVGLTTAAPPGPTCTLPETTDPLKDLFTSEPSPPLSLVAVNEWIKQKGDRLPKMPWETGPLQKVFGNRSDPLMLMPVIGSAEAVLGHHSSSSASPLTAHALGKRRLRATSFVTSPDHQRWIALGRFKTLVLIDCQISEVGRCLLSEAGSLRSGSQLARMFEDVFAGKATSTLLKHSAALIRYSKWARDRGVDSPLDFTEPLTYDYICHLRDSNAQPQVHLLCKH